MTRDPSSHEAKRGPLQGKRELSGKSCEEVTSAGALVIALAIDPDAVQRHEAAEAERAMETPPAPVEAPAAEPTPAPAPQVVYVPVPAPVTANAAPPPNTDRSPVTAHIAARTLLDVGSLPGPSLGVMLASGISSGRLRGELGAGYVFPRFADAEGTTQPARGADVSLAIANLRGCYTVIPERVAVDGCVGLETGALIAVGQGFDRTTTSVSPWLAAEGLAALRLAATRSVSVGLGAGVLVPFGRSRVRFEQETEDGEGPRTFKEFHRPEVASLRAYADVAFAFH